jgi:hypothetical protein
MKLHGKEGYIAVTRSRGQGWESALWLNEDGNVVLYQDKWGDDLERKGEGSYRNLTLVNLTPDEISKLLLKASPEDRQVFIKQHNI